MPKWPAPIGLEQAKNLVKDWLEEVNEEWKGKKNKAMRIQNQDERKEVLGAIEARRVLDEEKTRAIQDR